MTAVWTARCPRRVSVMFTQPVHGGCVPLGNLALAEEAKWSFDMLILVAKAHTGY